MKSQVWSRLWRIDYMKSMLYWFVGASASRTVVQYNSIYLAFHLSVLYLSSLGFFVLPILYHTRGWQVQLHSIYSLLSLVKTLLSSRRKHVFKYIQFDVSLRGKKRVLGRVIKVKGLLKCPPFFYL